MPLTVGQKPSQLKPIGHKLKDGLKHISRSRHRGGMHPNLSDETPPLRPTRGKLRQVRSRSLQDISSLPPIAIYHNEDDEDEKHPLEDLEPSKPRIDLDPSAFEAAERAEHIDVELSPAGVPPPVYDDDFNTPLAYAVSRMPGCYASIRRILEELKRLHPEFAPHSLLDFGAGPGTASWAMQDAWPELERLTTTAIEKSLKMGWLGQELLTSNDMHNVRWLAKLQDRTKRHMPGANALHDVVIAGYVLGELPSDSDRRQTILQLWERTRGVMILIEPGTPSGANIISKARDLILSQSSAHVLAPCSHDKACPLAGRRTWCHFAVRYERPDVQRKVSAPASLAHMPQGHGTEKFSYIVLRRGDRKSVPDVDIASSYNSHNESSDDNAVPAEAAEEIAEHAVMASSQNWSRILRPARKRSGHVVLDLCSSQGELKRQIVSKGSSQRGLGGTAAYRLARKSNWGDLWPGHYERSMPSIEPPDADAVV